jgi:signal transduction histidine kinase
MKIKPKLTLGIGVMFLMILLLTILSVIYINRLRRDTANILVDNYNTLDYSRLMLQSLNAGIRQQQHAAIFEKNLYLQEKNVTEEGEHYLTIKLAADYERLKLNFADSTAFESVSKDITNIMLINMQAIAKKSSLADHTSKDGILWLSLCGTVSFLIAFVMLVNLPGNIADPIRELTESIKQIASQNYAERLHFNTRSEFGELAAAFNTMAKKLQEYKEGNLEKIMIEKTRIETLINNMNDPVIGLDESKKILFMNSTALKISGLDAAEVSGKYIQDVAVNNDLIRSLVQDLFQTDNYIINKNPIKIYADNKESYFEKEIIPIKIIPTGETEEKLIGNVILLQNITPYKELDFAKTSFIATVSHELKTPISSIKMSLQLLENEQIGTINDGQRSLLDSIEEDAERLLKITGELLNMTQVESGSIQLSAFPSDPLDIINYAIQANKLAAEQKGISLDLSTSEELPMVIADSEKTAWVLTNLISNAIRYSYDNSTVRLEISSTGEKVQFSVKDTGQGIPPEYLKKVFDRYFRVPGTKKEGTGLGLSISKEFIEAEGGNITVTSEYGAGTTFRVTLNKA